ncbi:solute carrier family 35 [Capsaspora owczarzaki ATCC 30864]|uniref:Solute carrier family 35 n=1 Tax=Capsaspora owczarzaki (strain ATCC 30864) TaxID=595528 RepID=A0A0D2X446_CAPO3|nr:solute carrier family 35 [Capsaspora owczarzaki ATCC 30864]KJE95424.1 solute carrier family 35 [Capsaspora owczarzaki ATCC 30864]|eukprot:XP_004345469.1 solute carrier family 35 [Capsaspora owczarzaki ATCC 30864]
MRNPAVLSVLQDTFGSATASPTISTAPGTPLPGTMSPLSLSTSASATGLPQIALLSPAAAVAAAAALHQQYQQSTGNAGRRTTLPLLQDAAALSDDDTSQTPISQAARQQPHLALLGQHWSQQSGAATTPATGITGDTAAVVIPPLDRRDQDPMLSISPNKTKHSSDWSSSQHHLLAGRGPVPSDSAAPDPRPFKPAASRRWRIITAVAYGTCSLMIMFVNKAVLTTYAFPSFVVLALAQFAFTALVLRALQLFRFVRLPAMSRSVVSKAAPLSVLFVLNSTSGLGGTQHLSLPMLTVLRRFSIFLTMVLERLVLGNRAPTPVVMSVGLLILGAIVAAWSDLAYDRDGYVLVMINNLCTALSGVLLKKRLDARDLGTLGLLYYNSLLGIPLAMAYLVLVPEEWTAVANYPAWTEPLFVLWFALTMCMGLLLNYTMYLCTNANSPLTTTVVGVKNTISTYSGMMFGTYYRYSPENFLGINLSVAGSLVYSYTTFGASKSRATG